MGSVNMKKIPGIIAAVLLLALAGTPAAAQEAFDGTQWPPPVNESEDDQFPGAEDGVPPATDTDEVPPAPEEDVPPAPEEDEGSDSDMNTSSSGNWTDKITFSGYVSSDISFIVEDWRGPTPGDGYRFDTNRNDVNFKLKIDPNDNVGIVTDMRFRFYGLYDGINLVDLSKRGPIDPWDFQLNEAYVQVKGKPWSKMDFKIGRVMETWGTADMFNPTDNLNARDFSDPLDFFAKVPNSMVIVNIYPTDWLTITAAWLPIFKPAMLPGSAKNAFALPRNSAGQVTGFPAMPMDTEDMMNNIDPSLGDVALDAVMEGMEGKEELMGALMNDAMALYGGGKINRSQLINLLNKYAQINEPEVSAWTPGFDISNSQAALKFQFNVDPVTFSLSYFYGRFQFPVAYWGLVDITSPGKIPEPTGKVTDTEEFVQDKFNVDVLAETYYPRMHVVGADFSYSSDNKWVPGFFAEAALIIPEQVKFGFRTYLDGKLLLESSNVNVPTTPFIKATVGADWSYKDWIYINVQYVRGFYDEFNDMYGIHNYFVPNVDLMFFDNELLIRLTAALNCDDVSFMLFPTITWTVVPAVELSVGYMGFFGPTQPKAPEELDLSNISEAVTAIIPAYASKSRFGQLASGRNVVFFKAKVSW